MQVGFADQSKEKKSFSLPKWLSFLKDIHSDFYYYFFIVFMGILFFATSLFTNYFTTPFGGDYNSQQFAFYTNGYDDWWRFFTTGQFTLYDTNTFLGASNIGSNSFYYLFDPFFMPILLFPRDWIPQGMAIITIFKMALAGLLFHKYLQYLGITKKTARVAGLAYAFSGWIAWYLWFNHFTGILVAFPLMLWGVEKILREKRPWLLMISLMMIGFTNFFFFFTLTVCAFLYAMFRYFQRLKENNWKENLKILGIGFVGFFAGCCLAMMVVLPAMMVALHAPRAQEQTYLSDLLNAVKNNEWGYFFYKVFSWESVGVQYKSAYPIINFIFPPMSDRGTPLTKYGQTGENYDNVAGSLFCYSPFIMFLLPALISSARKKHFSVLIAFSLFCLMLFTPFCYYAFHGFTYAYSRWNIFVVTSLITYVCFYIDRIKEEPKWMTFIGSGFSILLIWGAYALACYLVYQNNFRFRYDYPEIGKGTFVLLEAIIATIYVLVITTIIFFRYNKKAFDKVLLIFVGLEVVVTGALTLEGHGMTDYLTVNNGYDNNVKFQQVIDLVNRADKSYFRAYSSQENGSARNDSMRHNYNGLGMFHSLYNFNDYAFCNWSTLNDYTAPASYSASYVEKRGTLDEFLGIKYYFVHKDKAFWGNSAAQLLKSKYYRTNVPIGYTDVSDQFPNEKYYVYRNDNHIDFAFAFDKVATYSFVDDKKSEPGSLLNNPMESEAMYLTRAIVNPDNLKYVENVIPEENIQEAKSLRSETKVSTIPNSAYSIKYYDIHKGSTSGGQDCSASSFVPKLLDLSEYPSQTNRPNDWTANGRYVTVIETNNYFPYDENGIALYLKNTYNDKNRINVYLVTKDENDNDRFLTFDNHNDSALSNNWTSRKNWRGFYTSSSVDGEGNFVPAPKITKIIICARKTSIYSYQFAYEKGTDYLARINALKEGGLTDLNYRENHFDFKSNFDHKKVVVTQLPHEDGWTITAKFKGGTEKKLDVFVAQGGFTSFIAEEGEVSYSMDFYTPYLKAGKYITAFGEAIFTFTVMGYIIYKEYVLDQEKKRAFGYSR